VVSWKILKSCLQEDVNHDFRFDGEDAGRPGRHKSHSGLRAGAGNRKEVPETPRRKCQGNHQSHPHRFVIYAVRNRIKTGWNHDNPVLRSQCRVGWGNHAGNSGAFIEYQFSYFMPLIDLVSMYDQYQSAMSAIERMFDLIDTKVEVIDARPERSIALQ